MTGRSASGGILILAALGMYASLVGNEIASFETFAQAAEPAFIGKALMQFGMVVTAYLSGQLVPTHKTLKKE